MTNKIIAAVGVGLLMGLSAQADSLNQTSTQSEALAWTVAAYSSCETYEALTSDFRTEADRMDAEVIEIKGALEILLAADNVCGLKNDFASDMLTLAVADMPKFESTLRTSSRPASPVFVAESPKGSNNQELIVLGDAANAPPQSRATSPSSDYSN